MLSFVSCPILILSITRKTGARQDFGTVGCRQSSVESFASSFCGVIFGLRNKDHLKRKVQRLLVDFCHAVACSLFAGSTRKSSAEKSQL